MSLLPVTIITLLMAAGAGSASAQASSTEPSEPIFSSEVILTSLSRGVRGAGVGPAEQASDACEHLVRNPSRQFSVNLPTVTFDPGSARLTPQGRRQLDELAHAFKKCRLIGRPVTIAGHTDARGSPDGNRALSARRAMTVRDYLAQRHDWPLRLMNPVGQGMSRLLIDLSRYSPEQRRIEVILEPMR